MRDWGRDATRAVVRLTSAFGLDTLN